MAVLGACSAAAWFDLPAPCSPMPRCYEADRRDASGKRSAGQARAVELDSTPLPENIYTSGAYLDKNPTWGVGASPWKADHVLQVLRRNHVTPATVCEIGCGAGEVLRQLQLRMPETCEFFGYEISPQAHELCNQRANDRLHFRLADFVQEEGLFFDLILLLDVIEHLEDYFSFLRKVRTACRHAVLRIPLEVSVNTILRNPIIETRERLGHLHYFTRWMATQVLEDVGFAVLDWHYAHVDLHRPAKSVREAFTKSLKRIAFAVHQDLAVRVVGGWSLIVLASSERLRSK